MPLKWMFKGNNYAEMEWMTWKPWIPWKLLEIILSQRISGFWKKRGYWGDWQWQKQVWWDIKKPCFDVGQIAM